MIYSAGDTLKEHWELAGDAGYSLSVGLQLADLKENHEVIFAVAGSRLRAGHGCQLGGRYCWKEEGEDVKRERRVKGEQRAD